MFTKVAQILCFEVLYLRSFASWTDTSPLFLGSHTLIQNTQVFWAGCTASAVQCEECGELFKKPIKENMQHSQDAVFPLDAQL